MFRPDTDRLRQAVGAVQARNFIRTSKPFGMLYMVNAAYRAIQKYRPFPVIMPDSGSIYFPGYIPGRLGIRY